MRKGLITQRLMHSPLMACGFFSDGNLRLSDHRSLQLDSVWVQQCNWVAA